MKRTFTSLFFAIFVIGAVSVFGAKSNLQKEAKISMKQARAIALKQVPGGKIASGELEREHGKLIYSFDIKTAKAGVTEVNVDAIDGKVIAVQKETAAKEAAEKKAEAKH
jgi:Peptidase propeptide and YPEB domain